MRLTLYTTSLIAFTILITSCGTSRKAVNRNYPAGVNSSVSALAQSYVDKYGEMAVHEMKRTGIPASITLAQGMIESDFGRSSLATQANNHFGIKCHNTWDGPKIYHDDETKSECFRRYKSPEESYSDHSDFLLKTPRYKPLFALSSTDYKGWAYGLKKYGYATNPSYASLLIDNIERYNLNAFDSGYGHREIKIAETTEKKVVKKALVPSSEYDNVRGGIVISAGEARVKERNRVQYIIVREGDTFESLADEFQLLRWEISKYNELTDNSELYAGQILYLQPKRKKADVGNETYVVKDGDTMYRISQLYAMKLDALYKINFMDPGTEPAVGKRIKLR